MTDNPYPIEIMPVDITAYATGNTGTPYVTTFDNGKPGPHVMVMAVTHGNELCGAITLDRLFQSDVRPALGKLTLGFHNVAAYQSFDTDDPTASRFVDEDLNRAWGEDVLDGARDTAETRRAREMRPIIDTVDLLLDIHSMQNPCPPLMLCGPLKKGQDFALGLGAPEYVVSDSGHAAGKRLRDYGRFSDPNAAQNSLLLEAGQHWEQSSVDVSMDVTLRFLKNTGAIDDDFFDAHIGEAQPIAQKLIEVSGPYTIETNDFNWVRECKGMEVIKDAGTVLGHDGDQPVATPYDDCVLIMPNRRRNKGQSAVRFGRLVN